MRKRPYQSDGEALVEPVFVDNLGVEIPGAQLNRQFTTGGGGGTLTIEEVDGAPTVSATKLVLPNGTLGVVGTVATYTPTAGAGTVTNTGTLTDHAVIVGNGGVDVSAISVGTNGQLLIGQTGADPAFTTMSGDATITAAGVLTVNPDISDVLKVQVFS